ncbi:MAG: hypothetical protein EOP36_04240 [Rubrivivax sp.]|nr:MAG: hypothetical protein EOP36_04240 [Rubrivivax sp.]
MTVVELRSLSGDAFALGHGQCFSLTTGAQVCGVVLDMNNQGQLLVNQGYVPGASASSTGHVVLTPAL